MEDILIVQSSVKFDESIAIHAYQPYTSSAFNNNDEIRIAIKHQDLCLLPSRSSLHLHGQFLKADGTAAIITKLVNNALCRLFEGIRYKINAVD